MEPSNIDAADREFARKVQRLRSELSGRQQTHAIRLLRRRRYLPALLLTTLAAIVAGGLIYDANRQPKGLPGIVGPSAVGADPPPAIRSSLPALKTPTPPLPLVMAQSDALEPKESLQPVPAAAAAPPDADVKAPKLASVVVCQGVRDHEPIGVRDRFDLADQPRVYVWMEAYAKDPPVVIKHIYYHNGRKYCEVPLEIRYPHMRTWSYVTLGKPNLAGSWSVEIALDGRVLKKASFQVSDSGLPDN
jgi:Protein of unknown function (DUF2914)